MNAPSARKTMIKGIYKPKKKRFNILKTFEVFEKENLSAIKDKLVSIILIETENIFKKANLFELNFKNNSELQISVLNDQKTYNLLSNTWKRHRQKQRKEFQNKLPHKELTLK